jgi:hypothetical protein
MCRKIEFADFLLHHKDLFIISAESEQAMSKGARKEREARITNPPDLRSVSGGFSATTSAWYYVLVGQLYSRSKAAGCGGNYWPLAGIPMLLAGVEASVIEHQHLLRAPTESKLAGAKPLLDVLKTYALPAELLQHIEDLIEIRNEIIHPISRSTHCPEYIERLQKLGVLESGPVDSGATILGKMLNPEVFKTAIEWCSQVLHHIAKSDPAREWITERMAGNLYRILDVGQG